MDIVVTLRFQLQLKLERWDYNDIAFSFSFDTDGTTVTLHSRFPLTIALYMRPLAIIDSCTELQLLIL